MSKSSVVIKPIKEFADEKFHLSACECPKCHFHFAVDASYLDQVDNVFMKCPNCKTKIEVSGE